MLKTIVGLDNVHRCTCVHKHTSGVRPNADDRAGSMRKTAGEMAAFVCENGLGCDAREQSIQGKATARLVPALSHLV